MPEYSDIFGIPHSFLHGLPIAFLGQLLSQAVNFGRQFLLPYEHPLFHVVHLSLQITDLATHAKNAINGRQIKSQIPV
jgi:hypothetical protein